MAGSPSRWTPFTQSWDAWPSFNDIRVGARLLWSLPGFLRNPIGPDRGREILRRRLERREANFLTLMRRAVYGNPRSPYLQLLAMAGCEYRDLKAMVAREGIEGALTALYRQGVYLTVDEFKGRRLVKRAGATVSIAPDMLRNPLSTLHFQAHTSGSGGAPLAVAIDLASMKEEAVNLGLFLDARGGRGWVHGLWGVPGSSSMRLVMRLAACGMPPVRWFSHVDPSASGLHLRYRWSGRLLRLGGFLAGTPIPEAIHVPLVDPLPIARWMAGVLRDGRVPHLMTFASPAVRLCLAAKDARVDLRGAQFTLGGEPTTAARLAAIREVGARALPRYSSVEVGQIGHGCLAPEAPDEMHLMHDLHAVVLDDPEYASSGDGAGPLLITSLSPSAPFAMLNVSLGDRATVTRRDCGCPLQHLGWTTHLHTIQSHEKLTAGGVSLLDSDVIRVLDEVLPARFGGGPSDYQLVEEEDAAGRPRLRLLVHPSVGPLKPDAVAQTFLSAIDHGSGPTYVLRVIWREGRFFSVERSVPVMTGTGKILHLHHRRGG